jgi:hypothetical protein
MIDCVHRALCVFASAITYRCSWPSSTALDTITCETTTKTMHLCCTSSLFRTWRWCCCQRRASASCERHAVSVRHSKPLTSVVPSGECAWRSTMLQAELRSNGQTISTTILTLISQAPLVRSQLQQRISETMCATAHAPRQARASRMTCTIPTETLYRTKPIKLSLPPYIRQPLCICVCSAAAAAAAIMITTTVSQQQQRLHNNDYTTTICMPLFCCPTTTSIHLALPLLFGAYCGGVT